MDRDIDDSDVINSTGRLEIYPSSSEFKPQSKFIPLISSDSKQLLAAAWIRPVSISSVTLSFMRIFSSKVANKTRTSTSLRNLLKSYRLWQARCFRKLYRCWLDSSAGSVGVEFRWNSDILCSDYLLANKRFTGTLSRKFENSVLGQHLNEFILEAQ